MNLPTQKLRESMDLPELYRRLCDTVEKEGFLQLERWSKGLDICEMELRLLACEPRLIGVVGLGEDGGPLDGGASNSNKVSGRSSSNSSCQQGAIGASSSSKDGGAQLGGGTSGSSSSCPEVVGVNNKMNSSSKASQKISAVEAVAPVESRSTSLIGKTGLTGSELLKRVKKLVPWEITAFVERRCENYGKKLTEEYLKDPRLAQMRLNYRLMNFGVNVGPSFSSLSVKKRRELLRYIDAIWRKGGPLVLRDQARICHKSHLVDAVLTLASPSLTAVDVFLSKLRILISNVGKLQVEQVEAKWNSFYLREQLAKPFHDEILKIGLLEASAAKGGAMGRAKRRGRASSQDSRDKLRREAVRRAAAAGGEGAVGTTTPSSEGAWTSSSSSGSAKVRAFSSPSMTIYDSGGKPSFFLEDFSLQDFINANGKSHRLFITREPATNATSSVLEHVFVNSKNYPVEEDGVKIGTPGTGWEFEGLEAYEEARRAAKQGEDGVAAAKVLEQNKKENGGGRSPSPRNGNGGNGGGSSSATGPQTTGEREQSKGLSSSSGLAGAGSSSSSGRAQQGSNRGGRGRSRGEENAAIISQQLGGRPRARGGSLVVEMSYEEQNDLAMSLGGATSGTTIQGGGSSAGYSSGAAAARAGGARRRSSSAGGQGGHSNGNSEQASSDWSGLDNNGRSRSPHPRNWATPPNKRGPGGPDLAEGLLEEHRSPAHWV